MLTYYIQINVICLLFLALVYTRLHHRTETMTASRMTFLRLIGFAATISISDIIAFGLDKGTGAGTRFLIELSNIVYDLGLCWSCFAWMVYVNLRLYGLEYNHKKHMILSSIPLLILTLIICLNPITNWVFSIDETNTYSRENGIYLHWLVSWGYLIAAELKVIASMRKLASRSKREKLAPLLWFIAAPVAAAVLQMAFYGITVMQCGITFSIVLMAFGELQEKISRDALTGLNNRGALETYLSDLLQKGEAQLSLLMCDVDRFKQINDNLGHLVGDLALSSLSDVLKAACGNNNHPLFLCRYGGDEFIICSAEADEKDMQELTGDIEKRLAEFNVGSRNVFTLEISTGIARAQCAGLNDVESLIQLADERMYESKKAKKVQR